MRHLPTFSAFESEEISGLPTGWSGTSDKISREFDFRDFTEAMAFVNAVAAVVKEQAHHPTITVDFGKVLISTYTHESGKVTDKDLGLADAINRCY